MSPLGKLFFNPATWTAWPSLQAATWPEAEGGAYYGPQGWGEVRGKSARASRPPHALDGDAALRLWQTSIELTGIDPGLPPA